jgi:phosphate starvation-inducible PhoH-like protein
VVLLGPAGCGKSYIATAFAMGDVMAKKKKRIVLTRPIVESGESLGFLPGTMEEKVNPYVMPIFDCVRKLLRDDKEALERFIEQYVEIAPLAYMRGRSFDNAVCIFDEAQNATFAQLKLFLTRFEKSSKIVITGDPKQSDLGLDTTPLMDIVRRIESINGVGVIHFGDDSIVRHPLISEILKRLEG